MLISLLIPFISNLMKQQTHQSFQIVLSLQKFQQHLRKFHQIKRGTTGQSVFCHLLRVHINYKLKFDIHKETICKKAHIKLTALSRKTNYMELPKRCILMNSFFKAQFNYCPIIWMCNSRCLNNKISILHERCLRIIYNDKILNFEKFLNKFCLYTS